MDKPVFAIIDDGSHIPQHQVSTFDLLFRQVLLPGGTYIVEDIETRYHTTSLKPCQIAQSNIPVKYKYPSQTTCSKTDLSNY